MSAVITEAETTAAPQPATGYRRRRRWSEFILPVYMWLVLLYTIVPIAVMVIYGFNQAPAGRVTFAWQGFTLDWYRRVFEITDLTGALVNSLQIAALSTVVAAILGTPLAIALGRYRYRGKAVTDFVIFTDIAAPSVVVGAALLGFFIQLNLPRGFLTILISHIAFNVAFVVIVVRARVEGLGRTLEEAAQDLGADPWVTFWKVTFPLIFPGVLAAALLSFALSIDDFIITSFVSGQILTFPLWVFGSVKIGIPPQVFVMGTLIFLGGIVLAGVNVLMQRRAERSLRTG
jgi:spermidine/putrescine transport system permease protein